MSGGPQKSCPKCNTKVHVKVRICKNEECGYIFIKKDNDEERDREENGDDVEEENEVPERSCSICNDKFSPKLAKKTLIGDPVWVWMYENYCSAACFENGENKLFNFIYGLIYNSEKIKNNENPDAQNTFEKILANQVFSFNGSPEIDIPNDIIKIVNPENFVLRQTGGNKIDITSFIKLTSPRFPIKNESNQSNTSNSDLNIKPSKEFESTFDRAPPKKIKPIEENYPENTIERKVSDDLNLPLGDYLDQILDNPEVALEARKNLKPGKGKRICANCQSIIGAASKSCPNCGSFRKG